jgi:hypothetical protein
VRLEGVAWGILAHRTDAPVAHVASSSSGQVRTFRDEVDANKEVAPFPRRRLSLFPAPSRSLTTTPCSGLQVPAPVRQGARIRFQEFEVQVLKIDKRCRELEELFTEDYDELAKAKGRWRGKLMDIWFAAWDIASRAKSSAKVRVRARAAAEQVLERDSVANTARERERETNTHRHRHTHRQTHTHTHTHTTQTYTGAGGSLCRRGSRQRCAQPSADGERPAAGPAG